MPTTPTPLLLPLRRCCLVVSVDGEGKEITCISGIILDFVRGLVLTHGSVLGESVPDFPGSAVVGDLRAHSGAEERLRFVVRCTITKEQCSATDQTIKFSRHEARILLTWRNPAVAAFLDEIFPSQDWKLIDRSNREETDALLSTFILLQTRRLLPDDELNATDLSLCSVSLGETLYSVSVPFGALYPGIFFGSISKGVVSNVIGSKQEIIVSDIRCSPGSEGGALYVRDARSSRREKLSLAAVIICPSVWKGGDYLCLTVACSVRSVLRSLREHVDRLGSTLNLHRLIPWMRDDHERQKVSPMDFDQGLAADQAHVIVLVSVGNVWGSGIVLDAAAGLLLTAAHVILNHGHPSDVISVRLSCGKTGPAKCLYSSPPGQAYDLAVLRAGFDIGSCSSCHMACRTPLRGESVRAVGYSLFRPALNLGPSVTSGTVASVVSVASRPIMLQSTCIVHPGASGGALIATQDSAIVGILMCHVRDSSSDRSYPDVSFCIPTSAIFSGIQKYLKTGNKRCLAALTPTDNNVNRCWSLTVDQTHSKL